jgi:hypothetical protein
LGGVDDINKDKYGFIEDELSLHDAFTLRPIKLKIPENIYQQVVMQNSKLWIFTQRSNMLIKTEVDAAGQSRGECKVANNHQMRQNRTKLNKLFVDKTGLHCFMLTPREIYYNYYHSDTVVVLPVEISRGTPPTIHSIDIQLFDEADPTFFELLLGSEDGTLFHGAFQITPEGIPQTVSQIQMAVKTPEYNPIREIKIAKVKEVFLVLAITSTKLYQFVG